MKTKSARHAIRRSPKLASGTYSSPERSTLGEEELPQSIDAVLSAKSQASDGEARTFSADTMVVRGAHVFIRGFHALPHDVKAEIASILQSHGLSSELLSSDNGTLIVPAMIQRGKEHVHTAELLGRALRFTAPQEYRQMKWRAGLHRRYTTGLDFSEIESRARHFSDVLDAVFEEHIVPILLRYETYEVAQDETARTLDLLRNLRENETYFQRQIGSVTTFLPRNQPLYAFTCFAIIPSLMAREVHVRAPLAMSSFFFDLMEVLEIAKHFPNIVISRQSREEFLQSRSAVATLNGSNKAEPVTDAVIFTGTMENADKMRQIFDSRVLFISNGAGHNPVVVSETADLEQAVRSVLRVQLYNQGQDCAAPNAILVHEAKYEEFVSRLRSALKEVRVGLCSDRRVTVGPLSERRDLKKIQSAFVDHAQYLDPVTPGIIHTHSALVEPTIILRPLRDGGNFVEHFAPIFFVQRYHTDSDLSLYFEDAHYAPNAMYVTLFGASPYVESLIGKRAGGQLLHDASTIIRNTDLHAPGIERGTQPYGGFGRAASCISIRGKITAKPTLPQRDIFEQLVLPTLHSEADGQRDSEYREESVEKNSADAFAVESAALDTASLSPLDQIPALALHSDSSHWAESIAKSILEYFPGQELYTAALHAVPDRPQHAGDLRSLLTAYAVSQALKQHGKSMRLLFMWEDMEPLEHVPEGSDPAFQKNVGLPVSGVADPLGEYASLAERFSSGMEAVTSDLGLVVEYQSQAQLYQSGYFDAAIFDALQRKREIAEELLSLLPSTHAVKVQHREELFLETTFPIIVFSRFTGKASTEILDYDGGMLVTYRCLETQRIDTVNLAEERRAKLRRHIERAVRWSGEMVSFETGTHSEGSSGGVMERARQISHHIFQTRSPLYVSTQTVGVQGRKESVENAVSLSTLARLYEGPLLLWMYLSHAPDQRFHLACDEEIFTHYEAFDRATMPGNRESDVAVRWSVSEDQVQSAQLPLRQALSLGQIVDWDAGRMRSLLRELKIAADPSSIVSRMRRARYLLEQFAIEEPLQLRTDRNTVYLSTMPENSRGQISRLHTILRDQRLISLEELEHLLYDIAKDPATSPEENRKRQRAFFRDVYQLLLGKDTGPRLSTLLWGARRDLLVRLLNVQE